MQDVCIIKADVWELVHKIKTKKKIPFKRYQANCVTNTAKSATISVQLICSLKICHQQTLCIQQTSLYLKCLVHVLFWNPFAWSDMFLTHAVYINLTISTIIIAISFPLTVIFNVFLIWKILQRPTLRKKNS